MLAKTFFYLFLAQAFALNLFAQDETLPRYFSVSLGGVEGQDGQKWTDYPYEIRVGLPVNQKLRVDTQYSNEGHRFPIDDGNGRIHRDGFATQIVYRDSLNKLIKLEIGVGPYFSMNSTTNKNDIEIVDKHLGILATAAALIYLEKIAPGLHLRVGLQHVEMFDAPDSNAFLVGIGQDFISSPSGRSSDQEIFKDFEVDAFVGIFQTNYTDLEEGSGIQVEIKKYFNKNFALSLGYIEESQDARVNNRGVNTQAWVITPLGDAWEGSFAAGPYVTWDKENQDKSLQAIATMQFKYQATHHLALILRLNRIIDFKNDNDRDVFSAGIGYKW